MSSKKKTKNISQALISSETCHSTTAATSFIQIRAPLTASSSVSPRRRFISSNTSRQHEEQEVSIEPTPQQFREQTSTSRTLISTSDQLEEPTSESTGSDLLREVIKNDKIHEDTSEEGTSVEETLVEKTLEKETLAEETLEKETLVEETLAKETLAEENLAEEDLASEMNSTGENGITMPTLLTQSSDTALEAGGKIKEIESATKAKVPTRMSRAKQRKSYPGRIKRKLASDSSDDCNVIPLTPLEKKKRMLLVDQTEVSDLDALLGSSFSLEKAATDNDGESLNSTLQIKTPEKTTSDNQPSPSNAAQVETTSGSTPIKKFPSDNIKGLSSTPDKSTCVSHTSQSNVRTTPTTPPSKRVLRSKKNDIPSRIDSAVSKSLVQKRHNVSKSSVSQNLVSIKKRETINDIQDPENKEPNKNDEPTSDIRIQGPVNKEKTPCKNSSEKSTNESAKDQVDQSQTALVSIESEKSENTLDQRNEETRTTRQLRSSISSSISSSPDSQQQDRVVRQLEESEKSKRTTRIRSKDTSSSTKKTPEKTVETPVKGTIKSILLTASTETSSSQKLDEKQDSAGVQKMERVPNKFQKERNSSPSKKPESQTLENSTTQTKVTSPKGFSPVSPYKRSSRISKVLELTELEETLQQQDITTASLTEKTLSSVSKAFRFTRSSTRIPSKETPHVTDKPAEVVPETELETVNVTKQLSTTKESIITPLKDFDDPEEISAVKKPSSLESETSKTTEDSNNDSALAHSENVPDKQKGRKQPVVKFGFASKSRQGSRKSRRGLRQTGTLSFSARDKEVSDSTTISKMCERTSNNHTKEKLLEVGEGESISDKLDVQEDGAECSEDVFDDSPIIKGETQNSETQNSETYLDEDDDEETSLETISKQDSFKTGRKDNKFAQKADELGTRKDISNKEEKKTVHKVSTDKEESDGNNEVELKTLIDKGKINSNERFAQKEEAVSTELTETKTRKTEKPLEKENSKVIEEEPKEVENVETVTKEDIDEESPVVGQKVEDSKESGVSENVKETSEKTFISIGVSEQLEGKGKVGDDAKTSSISSESVSKDDEEDDFIVVCQDDSDDELSLETPPPASPVSAPSAETAPDVNENNAVKTDDEETATKISIIAKDERPQSSQKEGCEEKVVDGSETLQDVSQMTIELCKQQPVSKEASIDRVKKNLSVNQDRIIETDISDLFDTPSDDYSETLIRAGSSTTLENTIYTDKHQEVEVKGKEDLGKHIKSEKSDQEESKTDLKDQHSKQVGIKTQESLDKVVDIADLTETEKHQDKEAECLKLSRPTKKKVVVSSQTVTRSSQQLDTPIKETEVTLPKKDKETSPIAQPAASLSTGTSNLKHQAPTPTPGESEASQSSLPVKNKGGSRLSSRFKYSKLGALRMNTRLSSSSAVPTNSSQSPIAVKIDLLSETHSTTAIAKTEEDKETCHIIDKTTTEAADKKQQLSNEADENEEEDDDMEDIDFCIEPTGQSAFLLLSSAVATNPLAMVPDVIAAAPESEESDVEILDRSDVIDGNNGAGGDNLRVSSKDYESDVSNDSGSDDDDSDDDDSDDNGDGVGETTTVEQSKKLEVGGSRGADTVLFVGKAQEMVMTDSYGGEVEDGKTITGELKTDETMEKNDKQNKTISVLDNSSQVN